VDVAWLQYAVKHKMREKIAFNECHELSLNQEVGSKGQLFEAGLPGRRVVIRRANLHPLPQIEALAGNWAAAMAPKSCPARPRPTCVRRWRFCAPFPRERADQTFQQRLAKPRPRRSAGRLRARRAHWAA